MIFEWDENKRAINYKKHGLSFEDAHYVFSGKTISFLDDRKDYSEPRYITMGELVGRVVIIVYTIRNDAIRIISMRKANAREQRIYQKRLEKN